MLEKSARDLAAHKLYILYILSKVQMPLSDIQLTHIFMETDVLDYFSLQMYIHELEEAELMRVSEERGLRGYRLTEKGFETLYYFIGRIDSRVRERFDQYVEKHQDELLQQRDVRTHSVKLPSGSFEVSLEILDQESPFISLALKVPSNKTAQSISENWKKNASGIYGRIVEALIQSDSEI